MELNYTKMGKGPNLFILHGLYGTGENWFNIGRALSNDYTVFLIDQRNHGRSPHSLSHTYNDMSADLEELVKKLNIKSLNIIGHSMGGKTAMTFTLSHGDLVNKLINVDIAPYSYHDLEHFKGQRQFHETILERFLTAPIKTASSRKEIEAYFEEKIANKDTRRFLVKNLNRLPDGGFSWKLNATTLSNSLLNVIDAVPPIKLGAQSYVDSLFIRGEKSPYISDEDIESIPDIFPNAKFLSYENSGHWLHAEEPERFIADAREFLA